MDLLADFITIDTESTGLEPQDQIIQLSIINLNNEVLFNQYFKPTVEIHPDARKVHGISPEFLSDKPHFDDFKDTIVSLLNEKFIIGYKVGFDMGMLDRQLGHKMESNPLYRLRGVIDLIEVYAEYHGEPSSKGDYFKWQKLTTALKNLGITEYVKNNSSHPLSDFHNALTDVRATNELFFRMVEERPELIHGGIYQYLDIEKDKFYAQSAKFRLGAEDE